jgi:ankyrin repeat protein
MAPAHGGSAIYVVVCKDGKTALMHACANGHLNAVAMLLEKGANIEATDKVIHLRTMLMNL